MNEKDHRPRDRTARIHPARSDAAEALEQGAITPAEYVARTLREVRERMRDARIPERPDDATPFAAGAANG